MEIDIRSALLADDEIDRVVIRHKGHEVEIKPPTLAQQRQFSRLAKDKKTNEIDGARLVALAVIGCTYKPGTNERIFQSEDEDALMNKNTHHKGIVGKISRELNRLMSEKQEDVEESFAEGQTGN